MLRPFFGPFKGFGRNLAGALDDPRPASVLFRCVPTTPGGLHEMPNEILRLPKVLHLIGMSRSWLYDELASGRFPAPVKLGVRAIGWRRSDIED